MHYRKVVHFLLHCSIESNPSPRSGGLRALCSIVEKHFLRRTQGFRFQYGSPQKEGVHRRWASSFCYDLIRIEPRKCAAFAVLYKKAPLEGCGSALKPTCLP
jgi:hypothetical protein